MKSARRGFHVPYCGELVEDCSCSLTDLSPDRFTASQEFSGAIRHIQQEPPNSETAASRRFQMSRLRKTCRFTKLSSRQSSWEA